MDEKKDNTTKIIKEEYDKALANEFQKYASTHPTSDVIAVAQFLVDCGVFSQDYALTITFKKPDIKGGEVNG